MSIRWAVPVVPVVSSIAVGASVVALVWVWQWSVTNTSAGDFEHQCLLRATFIACLLIATLVILVRVIDSGGQSPALRVISNGATGAFVAVILSVAVTMLVMWALRSRTDPGEVGRTLFPLAYVAALVISLGIGLESAWSTSETRARRVMSLVLALSITLVAWGYLAVGSSELNRCAANVNFPLDTTSTGECSGY